MDYELLAKELRRDILTILYNAKGSFSGGSLSCADLMTVLFEGNYIRINADRMIEKDRDMFFLSKGHCSSALYASLSRKGLIPKEDLLTYGKDGTKMIIHPKKGSYPGIEASTGSLGHGLALATGSALAAKINGYDSRVFVLMGDGECNEGSVWENAAFASKQKLNNLVAIVDRNRLQGCGRDEEILNYGDIAQKFEAFGFDVYDIDGHNCKEIDETFARIVASSIDKPHIIIANTIKGKGVSFMEDRLEWHYKSTNEEQYYKALEELK